ncbi:MAG TPA: HEAT repeat domain-containing protein, partial [candidate division Zixibacteria bacterium]|nr:HEAT repeat domain-containing protein [candidate division Zixibacteria bacterium]
MSSFSDSQNIIRPDNSAQLRQSLQRGSDADAAEHAGQVVRELHRTVKAVCLYPETNPVCQSAIERFTTALGDYVQRYHRLTLSVSEHGFSVNGAVPTGARDDESSLPSRCFACGIRELTFTSAITPDSIHQLLTIIRGALTDSTSDADLVDALWSEQIDGFSYDAIEDLGAIELDDKLRQEYFSESESERDHTEDSGKYQRIFVGDQRSERIGFAADSSPILESTLKNLGDDEVEESERPVMPTAEEMITRVYELTTEEEHEAQRQLAADAAFDNERELFSLTSDILEQDQDLPDYIDTLDVCLRTHGRFVESGQLRSAALLVNVIRRSADDHKDQRPTWSRKAVEALTAVASRERLHRVADVLNAHESISGEELTEYLAVFDWTAYAALTELLGRLEHKDHRLVMCEFLARADEEHIDLLASGIYDKRWYVVRNAVNILLEFNNARAHKHLEKALANGDPRIREIILNGCANHDQQFVCRALQLLLNDPEDAIRTR